MNLELLAGGLLCALSALFFYSGGRNQRLLAAPLDSKIAATAAMMTLIAGTALLLRHMGSGSAIFTVATILMTLLSLLPFIGLLKPAPLKPAPHKPAPAKQSARKGGRTHG